MNKPICYQLYSQNLNILESEIRKRSVIVKAGTIIGYTLSAFALILVILPTQFKMITLDIFSKFATVFLSGIFFSVLNFSTKISLSELKKKKIDIENIIMEDYDNFDNKTEDKKREIENTCKELLDKKRKDSF